MVLRAIIVVVLVALVAGLTRHVQERKTPVLESGPSHRPRGAYHVRGDVREKGLASLDTLASRAKAAGLSFVVVTDDNAQLAAPVVRNGVVILSYGELATPTGLVVGLGASNVLSAAERMAPGVHAAIRALGGTPVVSHPSDPKRPWTGELTGAGGIEIASFAATARRAAGSFSFGLLPLVLGAQVNARLALAQLYAPDHEALALWDAQPLDFAGFCGAGSLKAIDASQDLSTWNLILDRALPDDPALRPAALLDALTHGGFFCAAGLFGEAPYFEFSARSGNAWTGKNGSVVRDVDAAELVVLAPSTTLGTPSIVLLRNGEEVLRVDGRELRYAEPAPGVYRVEVRVPLPYLLSGERPVPVIYSNRIRVVSTTLPGLVEDSGELLP